MPFNSLGMTMPFQSKELYHMTKMNCIMLQDLLNYLNFSEQKIPGKFPTFHLMRLFKFQLIILIFT